MATTTVGPTDHPSVNVRVLADRWWTIALRGALAMVFGILVLARPGAGLLALVLLFGAYAIADGIMDLVLAFRRGRSGRRWGWFAFEGLVSIAAGLVAFAWPGITLLALLLVIAAWAVIRGVAEIVLAVRLRKQIQREWLLVLSGIASIGLGLVLFFYPVLGAVGLAISIGAYALVFGGLQLGLAFRLRRWRSGWERPALA